jgi:hypothetical protein
VKSAFRRAQEIDGHKSANLYNAIDNLIASAEASLAMLDDPDTQHAAALRGKVRAYKECRKLLADTARYRPRLLGDPADSGGQPRHAHQ